MDGANFQSLGVKLKKFIGVVGSKFRGVGARMFFGVVPNMFRGVCPSWPNPRKIKFFTAKPCSFILLGVAGISNYDLYPNFYWFAAFGAEVSSVFLFCFSTLFDFF